MANTEEKEEDKESEGREVVTGNEFSRRCQLRKGVARREDIRQGQGTLLMLLIMYVTTLPFQQNQMLQTFLVCLDSKTHPTTPRMLKYCQ